MKKFYSILLLIIFGCILVTCKKVEEAEKGMFDGSARVKGAVYFNNILKGTRDTAKTAGLTVYKQNSPASTYVITLKNGTYDISGLSDGKYTFQASYTAIIPGGTTKIVYQEDIMVEITGDQLNIKDLVITKSQADSPTLILQVQDSGGAPVKNAAVCLYADPLLLQKNLNKCSGSIQTLRTNDAGIVVFPNLTNVAYYASAYSVSGSDTTSNSASALATPYGPYNTSGADSKTVKIFPDRPSLSLSVTDASGANISGAQVCIYSDPALIIRYANKCTGSLKSAVSDANGTVIFSNMQPITYYISAFKVIGTDTISNLSTILTATPKLSTSTNNKVTVVLVPEKPTLNVVVTDVNGANISGAQVCIFSDQGLISKYGYKCTGSLKSSISDQNGAVAFSNMQILPYYISASKIIGKDTLSNVATSLVPTAKLTVGTVNKVTVIIK